MFCNVVAGGSNKNNIDYVTISSTGNSSNFGDISDVLVRYSALSNETRGILLGGYDSAETNTNALCNDCINRRYN